VTASPALAAALKDFGAPRRAAAEPFSMPAAFPEPIDFAAPAFEAPEVPDFPELPPVPEVDTEALIAEAVAKAEAELPNA